MRIQLPAHSPFYLVLVVLALAACDSGLDEQLGVVKAKDLSGNYTGVLEGVSVDNLDDIEDRRRHVIVDVDLLHELTIREAGELTVRIESPIIPPLRAFVAGIGPVALNAEFIEFEGIDLEDPSFEALKVKQIVFVQYEDEWVVVLQLARVGIEEGSGDGVYVYQYVSYPAEVAARMSEEEAIVYVNTILRLVSAVQRL